MEVSKFAEEELRRTEAIIKRQDAAGDDPDKGHADSAAAAQAAAVAVLGNGTNHFDSDTANLFINDMKKQGGANRDRWIPP